MKSLILALPLFLFSGPDADASPQPDRISAQTPDAEQKHKRQRRTPAQIVKKLDTDGNGSISAAEAEGSRLAKRFDKVDADHDGQVTTSEIARARAARKAKKQAKNGKNGKQAKDGKGGKHGKHGKNSKHGKSHMKKPDTNHDGSISRAEAEGTRVAKHFDKIDTNGDGQITKEEMKAAHKARKAKGKGKGKGKSKGKGKGKSKGKSAKRGRSDRQARGSV